MVDAAKTLYNAAASNAEGSMGSSQVFVRDPIVSRRLHLPRIGQWDPHVCGGRGPCMSPAIHKDLPRGGPGIQIIRYVAGVNDFQGNAAADSVDAGRIQRSMGLARCSGSAVLFSMSPRLQQRRCPWLEGSSFGKQSSMDSGTPNSVEAGVRKQHGTLPLPPCCGASCNRNGDKHCGRRRTNPSKGFPAP